MQQLNIEYFFPLTEQIPLDLDFTQCSAHQYYVRAKGIAGVHGPIPTGMVYKLIDSSNTKPGFQIDVDQSPITVVSKNKPNLIKQYLYKIMGINWKTK